MATAATQVHSFLAPAAVRSLDMKAVGMDVGEFEQLRKIGIHFGRKEIGQMADALGMDSAPIQGLITQASVPALVQFLQAWMPGFVQTITAARKIDDLVGIATMGSWEDEEVVQGILEVTGTSVPYGDYTNVPLASWNLNFEPRTIVRFEEGLKVGRLEEMRAAKMRVNSGESKREGAAQALEIQRNGIGFYGYNSGLNRTYGFFNDPNLPAYITVAASGSGSSTLWANKTFLEIIADIRTAIVGVRTQSQDQIDPEKLPMTLALPTDCVDYLSVVTDFGISVRDWLTKTYPKIRVVSAPELNNANSSANVFYLYADAVTDNSTDDHRTWVQAVQSKFMVVGVAKTTKGSEEDYANATAGLMLKRPYAVYRGTGI